MANDQHSGRYPWGDESPLSKILKENANFKVTKIVETKEGLKVEATTMKTEKIDTVLKILDYCSTNDECCDLDCPYYGHEHCLCDLMKDAIQCINQLVDDSANCRKVNLNYIAKLKKEISKHEDDNDYLKYEVDTLTSQNKALSEKLSTSEKKLEHTVTENYNLQYEVDALVRHNKKFSERITELEDENEELKKKLVLRNDTAEERRKTIQYYVDQCGGLEHEVESLKWQNKALSEKLYTSESNCRTIERTRVEAETRAKKLRDTLERCAKENVELKGKLKDASDTINGVLKNAPARNCVNCDHYDVCAVVAERKASKANNYKPCFLWKKADEE